MFLSALFTKENFYYFDRYYSMYGHVERLAEELRKGVNSVEGVEATLWQACIYISFTIVPNPMHSILAYHKIANSN